MLMTMLKFFRAYATGVVYDVTLQVRYGRRVASSLYCYQEYSCTAHCLALVY